MANTSPRLRRRTFVQFVGLAAGGIGPLLSACSQAAPAASTPTAAARSAANAPARPVFPTYQAATNRPASDFVSKGPLYEDGYNSYPANPVRSVADVPGSGGAVTAFVQPLQPPPTPFESNPAWQEVNKQLGAQFNFNMVPVADYRAKLTTLMAGTDLPDLINAFRGINGIANLPPFLTTTC